jgi:hypothetical protein
VAQSSPSGWLVCGHWWVQWPPRAGYRSTTRFAPPRAKSPRSTVSEHRAVACSFQKFGEEPFSRRWVESLLSRRLQVRLGDLAARLKAATRLPRPSLRSSWLLQKNTGVGQVERQLRALLRCCDDVLSAPARTPPRKHVRACLRQIRDDECALAIPSSMRGLMRSWERSWSVRSALKP